MLLSLCIPTFNRCQFLNKNLKLLSTIISNLGEESNVEVIVLDNCSSDQTCFVVQENQRSFEHFKYIVNEHNLGAKNLVKALMVASSEYIMLIGDDDYISEEYLQEVLSILRNDKPQMIIGNFVGVDSNLNNICEPREKEGKTYCVTSYEEKLIMSLELCHQMSGLVYKKFEIDKFLLSIVEKTLYPQIYLALQVASEGSYFHILNNPIKVIQTNSKTWKYDVSGLLFDILSGIYYLPISNKEKELLEIKSLKRPLISKYRVRMGYKHPVKLFCLLHRCKTLEKGFKNYFIIYFFYSLIFAILKKIVKLLFCVLQK